MTPEHYAVPNLTHPTGDQVGHGTAVASLIVGKNVGVARKATIVDVKVFESGPTSMKKIAYGVRWAIDDIIAKKRTGKATLNFSFSESPASLH